MKKVYLTLFMTFVASVLTLGAANNFMPSPCSPSARLKAAGIFSENKGLVVTPQSRAEEDDHYEYVDITVSEAQVRYMGDLLDDGTGFYYVVLANTGIDAGGAPVEAGAYARVLINAEAPADPSNFEIPVGEFTPSDTYGEGSFDPKSSAFLDCFIDDWWEMLVYYQYDLVEGSLTITKEADGTYTMVLAAEGNNVDKDGTVMATATIGLNYAGTPKTLDDSADPSVYPPLEQDYEMQLDALSGMYSEETGLYSLTFYDPDMLDKDGFVVGAGMLLEASFYTDPADPKFAGEYKWYDTEAYMNGDIPKYGPGDYMSGFWMQIYGDYYGAFGTYLALHDEDGYAYAYGLAAPGGTIKITEAEAEQYKIDFDLISRDGKRMTGTWVGYPEDTVENFPLISGIGNITINQPQGEAVYYNLQGVRIASPEKGQVVIRRTAASAEKVCIK